VAVSPPAVTGTAKKGQVLSSSLGQWVGSGPINYTQRWQRCDAAGASCVDVTGATSPTYALDVADVGHAVRLVVTATNNAGGVEGASAPTPAVLGDVVTIRPVPIDAGKVRSALLGALLPSSRRVTAASVARRGSYATRYVHRAGFGSGSLRLEWFTRVGRRTVLVARGTANLRAAARVTVTLKLTRPGRTLLRTARRTVALSAKGSYTPKGKRAITTTRAFSLRRR
jgi:hypothetical protein